MSITNTKYTELMDTIKGEPIKDIIEALATYCNDNEMDKESDVLCSAWQELEHNYIF